MNKRIRSFLVPVLFSAIALCAGAAPAAALPAFGHNGRVVTAFPGGIAQAVASAHDLQNRLILAGGVINDPNEDVALARYLHDGTLDRSFGSGGLVTMDLGGTERANGVAIDSRGRIVIAGRQHPAGGTRQPLVVRYLPDGTLDPSFGQGGIARIGSGHPYESGGAFAVAVDSADRVVVGGEGNAYRPGGRYNEDWNLVRLTSDGQLDPSYGEGGFGPGTGKAVKVALDHAGRIVLALDPDVEIGEGPESEPTEAPLLVERVTPDGQPDRGFGHGGLTSIVFPDGATRTRAVAVDARNRIVLAGEGDAWHVVRLLPDGSLDRSFSGDGRFSLGTRGLTPLRAVAVDSHNRVFLAGGLSLDYAGAGSAHPHRFALARLSEAGRSEGLVPIGFGPDRSFDSGANSLTIIGETVYAAGHRRSRDEAAPTWRFALVRYIPPR